MDRHLLTGTILVFLIELFIFLAEVGVVHSPFNKTEESQRGAVIGKVISARNLVRRRPESSIVWEDSNTHDLVYLRDAILTLKNSAVRIELENRIKVDLEENTLVVLEPKTDQSDDRLRLRFKKGGVRTRAEQSMDLAAEDWTIEAKPNAELSVRQSAQGPIEVEVLQGEIQVKHEGSSVGQALSSGQRVELFDKTLGKVQNLQADLQWTTPALQRIYANQSPQRIELKWQGQAQRLRQSTKLDRVEIILADGQDSHSLDLPYGEYQFYLEGGQGSSQSVQVQILPAPELFYFSPLPRDRVKTGAPTLFSWLRHPGLTRYELEIYEVLPHLPGATPKWKQSAQEAQTNLILDQEGSFFWRVVGFDEDGFMIPPSRSYPIFSVEDPLQRPKLAPPSLEPENWRGPASPPPPDSGRQKPPVWLQKIWQLLIPEAQAESKLTSGGRLIFSWFPVAGADHYILEVSETPDFINPLFSIKTDQTSYAWPDYEKKVYYYRVAAGKKDGRKGLFSDFDLIDVNQLTPVQLEKLKPEARVATDLPPTPPPVLTEAAPVQFGTVLGPELPTNETPKEEEGFSEPESGGKFALTPFYRVGRETSDNYSISYSGANPLGLEAETHIPIGSKRNLTFGVALQQVHWKNEKSQLIGQSDLEQIDSDFYIIWTESRQRTPIGAWFSQRAATRRTGDESVVLNSEYYGGLQIFHQQSIGKELDLHLSLGLGSGSRDFFARLQGEFTTPLMNLTTLNPYAGIRLRIEAASNFGNASLLTSDMFVLLGFDW